MSGNYNITTLSEQEERKITANNLGGHKTKENNQMDFLHCSVSLVLIWFSYRLYLSVFPKIPADLPPGPPSLPLIGNLLSLGRLPHRSLHELSLTYGPVLKLSLGRITTVVVSSPSLARDVLQTHDSCFSNRFVVDALTAHDHDRFGMASMPISPLFNTLRKIYNTHLFAARKLDGNRHLRSEHVRGLIQELAACARDGRAVNIGEASFRTTFNLLSNTLFSVNLAYSGDGLMTGELKQVAANIMVEARRPNIADFFPVLKRWDPQGIRRRMETYFGRVFDIIDEIIEKRMKARSEKGWCRKDDMLEILLDICQDKDEDAIDLVQIKHMLLVNCA